MRSEAEQWTGWKGAGVNLVFGLALAGAWWLATHWSGLPDYLFPPPHTVVIRMWEMLNDGTLFAAVKASLGRMLLGYGVSVAVGLPLGVLAARSRLFRATGGNLILALQSLPSVCWLPLSILWIGLNERAVLAVVVLGSVFSISVAVESSVRNIPPIYLKVGQTLGARGWVFARDILFFAALPGMAGGLKLGWSFAWRSLMAAELVRSDLTGIGNLLETGRQFNDPAMMLGGILTILALGLAVDIGFFSRIEKRIAKQWGLSK